MKLLCYSLNNFAPKIVAASAQRDWMDAFPDRHAYRCLPLSIANAHGWEVLCPVPIEIEWNGGPAVEDLTVRALKPLPGGTRTEEFCRSNFSRGIATFHLDYLFRTEPGWDLLATGPFNRPKDNAAPLTGIMEADWLPYPFTMNWQIQRPGRLVFEQDEPFCFIVPIKKQALVDCQPEIRNLADAPELARQHEEFRAARDNFMQRFHAGDEATLRQAWQKYYFTGRHPDGTAADNHLSKLRLPEPLDLRAPSMAASEASTIDAQPAHDSSAKWSDDSPLNAMQGERPCERNERGRRRIDANGRVADWSGIRVVRSSADADYCDFIVAEELLSPEQCDELSRAYRELAGLMFRSDRIDPYWNNRFIWHADIAAARPAIGALMIDAQRRAVDIVKEFYQIHAPLYPDLLQIVLLAGGHVHVAARGQCQPGRQSSPHVASRAVGGRLRERRLRGRRTLFHRARYRDQAETRDVRRDDGGVSSRACGAARRNGRAADDAILPDVRSGQGRGITGCVTSREDFHGSQAETVDAGVVAHQDVQHAAACDRAGLVDGPRFTGRGGRSTRQKKSVSDRSSQEARHT